MKRGSLESVTRAARGVTNERKILAQKIRAARAAGHPLRKIAEAAGLSHEQIRRMTKEEGS